MTSSGRDAAPAGGRGNASSAANRDFFSAFLAARNTTPSVRFVGLAALFVIITSRSINSLIWGLLLVAVIGPGILATVLVSEWVTAKVRHAVI